MKTSIQELASVIAPALAIAILFTITSCGGGGGDGKEVVALRLSTNQDCYGLQVDVGANGTDAACTASTALAAEGCTVSTGADANGLTLSAGNCFLGNGVELFSCEASPLVADEIRNSAEVRCGCGCSANCPSAPSLLVCDKHDDCVSPPAVAVSPSAVTAIARQPTISHGSQFTATSVSTTFCGTCCDVEVDAQIGLQSGSDIHELNFDVLTGDDGTCGVDCEFASGLQGPSSMSEASSGIVHACVASASGLDSPQELVHCEGQSGGSVEIRNVGALGADYRTVTPPPLIGIR